jgi:hypothetical protein
LATNGSATSMSAAIEIRFKASLLRRARKFPARKSAIFVIAGNIPRLMEQNCAWGHRPMFNRSDRNDKSGYDIDERAEIAALRNSK